MTTDESLNRRPGENAAVEFRQGQIIGAKYKITAMLGRGGMGVVYRVQQIFIGRDYALKTLDNVSDLSMRRFQLEAKAASMLDHPNLVQVHDFGLLEDGKPFLIMDLVDGITIADRLKRGGPISVDDAVRIFAQVCLGLSYAHDQSIVHRDIKPSNIMIVNGTRPGEEGSVKVLDFGIAKLMTEDSQALTRTGEVCGSPFYMSPEQCSGAKLDHRSDIYSLGCVLYEALTGAPPHMGSSPLTTMMLHQSQPALPLREASLGKQFPPALEQIVGKMLLKSPDERYRNLGLVANDLAMVSKGQAVKIGKPAGNLRLQQPAKTAAKALSIKPRNLWAIMIGVAVISGIAGAVAGYQLLLWQLQSAMTPGKNSSESLPSGDQSQPSVITTKDSEAKKKHDTHQSAETMSKDKGVDKETSASDDWMKMCQSFVSLGDVARENQDFDEAGKAYNKAFALLETHGKELSDDMAQVLLKQGIVAFSNHDMKKAEELFKNSLSMRVKLHGSDSPTEAETEAWLANTYSSGFKRYDQALICYQEAETLAKRGLPATGKVYARTLHGYGVCLSMAKRPKEAIEKLKLSSEEFFRYSVDDPELWATQHQLEQLEAAPDNVTDHSKRP